MGFRIEKKKKFEMDELNNASILNFQSFPFLEVIRNIKNSISFFIYFQNWNRGKIKTTISIIIEIENEER